MKLSLSRRAQVLEFVRKKIREGRQAYFVYPLIEESEEGSIQAAVKAHEELQKLRDEASSVEPQVRVARPHP